MEKKNSKKKKGFTLIELIIVIAIIGILSAIAIPKFGNLTGDAKAKSDEANEKVLMNVVSTLIAQDTIKLPSGETTKVVYVTSGTKVSAETVTQEEKNALINSLQDIPVPKVSGTHFIITINASGKITISK